LIVTTMVCDTPGDNPINSITSGMTLRVAMGPCPSVSSAHSTATKPYLTSLTCSLVAKPKGASVVLSVCACVRACVGIRAPALALVAASQDLWIDVTSESEANVHKEKSCLHSAWVPYDCSLRKA
jgi:hypothetical protein